MTTPEPLRQEVVVDLDPQHAFELFTERIGEWWPLAEFSVYGEGGSVAFRDGVIVETLGGREARWGEVEEWLPGERVSFSWYPGHGPDRASHVSVSFSARDDRTLVVLEHSGWEIFENPDAARSEYDRGWPSVLSCYAEAGREGQKSDADEGHTWVALLHRPGPEAPTQGSIFEDPRFADHAEFLSRMQSRGYLVAAGPMLDVLGEGMTILRLPGEGRLQEAERLATTEDASVRSGFFEVSVRPWRVMMSAVG
jgi:uncharacterized protein YciI